MKRMGLLIVVLIAAVALASIGAASAADKDNGKNLIAVDVIHWQKGYGKGGGGDNNSGTTCYAFLGKYRTTYYKWNTLPVSYVINPANNSGLSQNSVTSAIQAAAETWDNATSASLFNPYIIDKTAQWGVQDGKNSFSWGNYGQRGVIAVTRYWLNTKTGSIAEFDIMFDTDFVWGDATVNTSVMDLQNIATHELGHGLGLSDLYKSTCSQVTMYGYSSNGETSERSLETPDITGLRILYGN